MKQDLDRIDPKGLMKDAYSMPDLGPGECRSIFLDWALGVPQTQDPAPWIEEILAAYENAGNGIAHPMTDVLREGLTTIARPRRRGGRRGRTED